MSSRRHRTAAQGARPGEGRAGERARKGPWERPQVLFREPLEAVAVACVPTVDEDAWEKLEPGVAHPMQRLKAVRQLVDAGIDCGVLMAPIVPGFSTQPAKIERTVLRAFAIVPASTDGRTN